MDTKNRLIQKLLKVAKKHKILTYPVLVLVVIISALSNMFSWSTGAGKRIVAVIMVMVMLVSQSYFLTSSATEAIDDEETALVQQEIQQEVMNQEIEEIEEEEEKDTTEAVTEVASDSLDKKENVTDNSGNNDSSDVIEEESMDETAVAKQVEETEYVITDKSVVDEASSDYGVVDEATSDFGTPDSTDITDEEIDSKLAPDADGKTITVQFFYTSNSPIPRDVKSEEAYSDEVDIYTFNLLSEAQSVMTTINTPDNTYNANGCYEFDGIWYSDPECTTPVTEDRLSAYTIGKNETLIRLYAKRNLVKYRVNIVKNDDNEDKATYTLGPEASPISDNSCYVDITEGRATLTLSNLVRHGYDPKLPTLSEGSATIDSETVVITFTGTNADKTVTLGWTGKSYNITYAKQRLSGSDTVTKSVQYGSGTILEMEGTAEELEGWNYDCWTIGLGEDTPIVEPGISIKGAVYSGDESLQKFLFDNASSTILYPKYEYAGIEATTDKVEFHYLQKMYHDPVQGRYKKASATGGSRNFSYEITSGNAALIQSEYGVEVVAGDSGILFQSEGPIKTTGSSSLQVKFKVKDNNGTEDTSDDRVSEEFTIDIYIYQRSVTISQIADSSNIKPYDGNTVAKLNDTILSTDTENVTVTYTSAHYNSPNVSEATSIILEGAKIVVDGDDAADSKAKNYVLSSNSVAGSIQKRPVWVETSAVLSDYDKVSGYVRTGEADPEFKVEEDKTKKNVYSGLLAEDSEDDLMIELYSTRTDVDKTGIYTVKGNAANDTNYEVYYSKEGTFEVKQESPDDRYTYNDGLNSTDWHIGDDVSLIALNNSGYTDVWLYRKGSNTPDKSGKLTEEDTRDSALMIQLYDDNTGAITSKASIKVYYDVTAPYFTGYTIDEVTVDGSPYDYEATPGLYFPGIGSVLDFGTYINSQITLRIQYKDDTSDVAELHYGLFGQSSDSNTVSFNKETGIATVKILRSAISDADNTKGIITCYATDTAGVKSGETILRPKNSNNAQYEWSVEKGAPEVSPLIVYSGQAKNVIVSDQSSVPADNMAYYNHCQASVSVSDAVSGLESITWHINDDEDTVNFHDGQKHSDKSTYSKDITGVTSEIVTVYATVRDNAGNEIDTNKVTFKLDDVDPDLNVRYDDKVWTNQTTITFTASDDLSGVDYAKVTDADGKTIDCNLGKPDVDGYYTASFDATSKGTYTVVVADKAGNTAVWNKNIDKISTVKPECPEISIAPEEPTGVDGWYNSKDAKPSVTIKVDKFTSDDTPVTAKYRMWKEGETGYNDTDITGESVEVPVNDEGVFNVKAWVKSVSGVECDDYDDHVEVIKVDRTAPDITISTEKGAGSSIIVNFTVTDNISGVNIDSIAVEHSGNSVDITKEETADGVAGSFEIDETGNYTIKAADNAGNESDEAAFTPMSLKIKAVTNITENGATVAANVIKGTFDIKSAAISYRKYTDDKYTEAETIVNIDPTYGNAAVSAALSELEPATAYVFKVTATSDVNEVLEYEGYFKTLSTDQQGISVVGTARYSPEKTGAITVGIFEGNVCLMAEEIEAGNEFSFINVPNGNYNIIATDGSYSKTVRLLIEDGMIVYPTQYIDIVLSGMNTSLVLTTESTPGISVDDMDTIFDNDSVNFTTEDSELVDAGGTVEFKLYATLMTVSAVSADEISAMYAVTDNNKIVGAYLDLSLYKIVTDVDGVVDRKRITNLANPAHISVTIPLGDLAGKSDLEVVRIHNDGENYIGASLTDQDSNPNTYTITTDQFSTYAVLYSIEDKQATTEKTTTEIPTTEKNVSEPTTTEKPASVNKTTEQLNVATVEQKVSNVTNQDNTKQSVSESTDGDTKNVKKIKKKTSKPKSSNTTSVGSLTSSGSAKTGDETPIVLILVLGMMSVCGVFVLRRKLKNMDD